jgi:sRNA-binding carbon storage regulator CsrA
MSDRRQLEFGEKIVYQSLIGDNVNALVLCQTGQEVAVQISRSEPHVNIHRRQVVKTFKKGKKKPDIVWITYSGLLNLDAGYAVNAYPKGVNQTDIPLRPLTDKERKKWDV